MINHKELLKTKINNLQKLIDEVSDLNIGGIKMGGGNCRYDN